MSRLLILGASPLPFEVTNVFFAPGARTWQLAKPLLEDGHTLHVVGQRIPGTYPADAPAEIVRREGRMTYASVTPQLYVLTDYVRRVFAEFEPDAVVFPHVSASFHENLIDHRVPEWVDMNGHLMTEAQAKAAVFEDDSYLEHFFRMELGPLFRADVFSTDSDAQTYALIGELGLAGRLNSRTNGVPLVHTVPVGVDDADYEPYKTAFRGREVDDSAFVVLWSGGYNTWTAIDTMFEGLARAMERDESIIYVSTGGQIDGHDELTYPRFVEMVEASPYRDRFILRGWIPKDEVPDHYLEADVGINCEKDIYEVRFGSKQRILDWSRAALPAVSSRLTELSLAIEREKIGLVYPCGDARALAEKILWAARHRSEMLEMGLRCREVCRRIFSYAETCRPLLEWARNPAFAPDHDRGPLCLEALVHPPTEDSGRSDGDEEGTATELANEPDSDESRGQWLGRVVRHSWQEGGPALVVRRAVDRIRGPRSRWDGGGQATRTGAGDLVLVGTGFGSAAGDVGSAGVPVSIIVLNWNGGAVLARCLDHLRATDYPGFRVVVADNASTDGSLDAVQRDHPEVDILAFGRNHGFAEGNNRALRWVLDSQRPESVVLLNNDAFVQPDWLERLTATFERHPRAGVCGPKVMLDRWPGRLNSLGLNLCRDGRAWDEGIFEPDRPPATGEEEVLAITGAAMLVRAAAVREVGLLDPVFGMYCEDIDWCLRFRDAGWEVWCNRDAEVSHALSFSTGVSDPKKVYYQLRNRLVILLKHFPRAIVSGAFADEFRQARARRRCGARDDFRMQLRTLTAAIWLAPRLLAGRALSRPRQRPPETAWFPMVRPVEAMPLIEPPTEADPAVLDRTGGEES